ncbi:MAG: fasciclin domain-containing protein [Candidatus Eisenbacteria sp.]|nr:fasciclin domain-containing protein [Candidatus Eisenbacteria bacterium]
MQQADAGMEMEKLGILERTAHEGSFATLMAAVEAAGLAEVLRGEGPFTLFAPSDEAFAKLPPGTVESLLADKKRLAEVLAYHVVPGKVMAGDVAKVETAKTLYGQELEVKTDEEGVRIDEARIVAHDIVCKNGVIHVIDRVVFPGERS